MSTRFVVAVAFAVCLSGCGQPYDRHVQDEAAWIQENVEDEDTKVLPRDKEGTLYPTHPYDAFYGMDSHVKTDYGHDFSADEVKGRNTWVMWSGGNQEFWDHLSRTSNGIVDLLKLCDSRFVRRQDRFRIMGVVPHPGMTEADPRRSTADPYGLYVDAYNYDYSQYDAGSGDYGHHPGRAYVKGPRPDPKVYGYASGIVGLRLFPRESDVDPRVRQEWKENRHKWDPDRYIHDEHYYKDPDLIRPYRVGMSCGFCHIQANPMNPPQQMHEARWENLSSNIGNQYFWFGRIFGHDLKRDNLIYYLTNYAEPGTLDTSLVATDGNNNPNTMNSVYQLLPRILVSLQSPPEKVQPPDEKFGPLKYMPRLDQGYLFGTDTIVDSAPGANDVKPLIFTDPERDFLRSLGFPEHLGNRLPSLAGRNANGDLDPTLRHTPKVLAGGADSIGGRGALCRVYLNIGEFSEEWRQLHNTMIGVTRQRPFKMEAAVKRSLNWKVTLRRSTNVAKYFLAGSVPMRLEKLDGIADVKRDSIDIAGEYENSPSDEKPGEADPEPYVLPDNHPTVLRGAEVFARDCFVCHSSVNQPEGFWKDPGNWRKWFADDKYVKSRQEYLRELLDRDEGQSDAFFNEFVKGNYLSTDARYHVTEIGTNTARSLAGNGMRGRMWEDFSSEDFKAQDHRTDLITISHPYHQGETRDWPLNTEAGPGRYRPPSLSSMWAHAPYLHNNSVGYYPYEYGPDPRGGLEGEMISTLAEGIQTTDKRLRVFDDSVRRLLGLKGKVDATAAHRGFSEKPRRGFDSIVRVEQDATLALPHVVVPDLIYMQTMAFFGIGIPRWVVILLLLFVLGIGVYLFYVGGRRLQQGRGMFLRNVGAIVIGLAIIFNVISLWETDEYRVGHIPAGTPVNLVLNLNGPEWVKSSPERKKLLTLALIGLKKADKYKVESLEQVSVKGRPLVDILLDLSKCPDLVLDKGHEFGIYQTDELAKGNRVPVPERDREALIEFLKKL